MKSARLVAGGVILLLGLAALGGGRDEKPARRNSKRPVPAPMREETSHLAVERTPTEAPPATGAREEATFLLESSDPAQRADAVDALPSNRPDEAPAILERILASDPDSRVRERAVLAYAERLGPKAIPRIREAALKDPDENVASAARAALDALRTEHPEPAKGWLKVDAPESFVPGEIIDMRMRFGSSVDVAEVTLGLKLPRGVERVSPTSAAWKGSLRANRSEEVWFRLRVTADSLEAPLRASLKLDYAEELDVDRLRKEFTISVIGGRGRITAIP